MIRVFSFNSCLGLSPNSHICVVFSPTYIAPPAPNSSNISPNISPPSSSPTSAIPLLLTFSSPCFLPFHFLSPSFLLLPPPCTSFFSPYPNPLSYTTSNFSYYYILFATFTETLGMKLVLIILVYRLINEDSIF